MATEAERRAIKKYDAANTKQYHLKLNLNTDKALIECLDRTENVQGLIKDLLKKHFGIEP